MEDVLIVHRFTDSKKRINITYPNQENHEGCCVQIQGLPAGSGGCVNIFRPRSVGEGTGRAWFLHPEDVGLLPCLCTLNFNLSTLLAGWISAAHPPQQSADALHLSALQHCKLKVTNRKCQGKAFTCYFKLQPCYSSGACHEH